jgi:MSHA biogenesis protein MshL
MTPRTRTTATNAGLMVALVLLASTVMATGPAAQQGPKAAPVARLQPAPLAPIAVSQLEEGRGSEPQAAGLPVPLPKPQQAGTPPERRGQGPQAPGLAPIAVSQLEEGRRSDSLEQMIGLSFAEPIAIRDLLRLLVSGTSLSAVADPDVEGNFSGELKNVTLRQALDLSLLPNNLEYSLTQNVLRVRKHQMQTRAYNINYVAARRPGYLWANAGFGYGGTSLNGFAAGGVATPGAGSPIDTFAEIEKGLGMMLSPYGKLNLDRKAGLVQVTDYPDTLDRIANYLELVETRNLRQVHIQAKVIEVEMNEPFSAGIDWAAVLRSASNSVTLTQQLAPTSNQSAFTMGVKIKDVAGLLSAFASQGRVNVMASPQVMAMNNEPAVMRVGTQDVFFVTTSHIESSTGRIMQTTVTPQAINEGITLSVMAQISDDGIIHLSISPTVTERTGVATSRLGDQVPIVSVREADTMVRVLQGETVVIAGLMQEKTTGDRIKKKVDLVILLTPTVVALGDAAAMSAADQQRLYDEQRAPARK